MKNTYIPFARLALLAVRGTPFKEGKEIRRLPRSNGLVRHLQVCLCVLIASGFAAGQVPDGWWISTHLAANAGSAVGPGAIGIYHPTAGVSATPLSGLGPDLTGVGLGTTLPVGPSAAAIAPDGSLYVGEAIDVSVGAPYDTLELHRLYLGSTVTDTIATNIPLPLGTTQASVRDIHVLPNGDVVFTCQYNVAGGTKIWVYSPSNSALAPLIPSAVFPGGTSGPITANAAGTTIYVGGSVGVQAQVLSIDLVTGVVTIIATLNGMAAPAGIALFEDAGRIYTIGTGATGAVLAEHVLTPVGGIAAIPMFGGGTPVGMDFELETGKLAAAFGNGPARINLVGLIAGPVGSLVGVGPIASVKRRRNLARFGNGTPGPTSTVNWQFGWSTAPGLPIIGNPSFTLLLGRDVPGGGLTGLLGISASLLPVPMTVLGGTLFIDVFTPGAVIPISGADPITLTLSIPGNLTSLTAYAQAVFVDGAGFAWTAPLRATIL